MSVTPNRKTRVLFDVPDTSLVSPAWGIRRRGGEICPAYAAGQTDDRLHQNCRLTATGGWTLRPLQTEISDITEYEIGLSLIQVPDHPTLITGLLTAGTLAIENNYRYSDDLPGMPASHAALPSGGPFIVKRIPAGGSFDQSVASGTPSLLSGKAAPPVTPVDRVGESNQTYPENQAWFLNWDVPGDHVSYPQYTLGFYFGQFGIAFTGSGKAELYEYCLNTGVAPGLPGGGPGGVPPEAYQWSKRAEWKYARAGQVSGTAHSMIIFPHTDAAGNKHIEFTNSQVDFAQLSSSAQSTTATSTTPGSFVYTTRPDTRFAPQPRGVVTQAGPFRFDIRRDLALKLQVSTLGFPVSGYLIDDPASLPPQNSEVSVNAYADVTTPPGTGLVATLYDALSGDLYDSSQHTHPQARFDLAGDGSTTPVLWGYSMNRIALIDVNAPGEFTGGNLRSVNLAGYSGDPTQETGSLVVDDVRGELTALLNRGCVSVRVEVDHVEGGQTFTTPVFRGYVNRPEAERKVKPSAPRRHRLTLPLMGQWLKLAQATNRGPQSAIFYNDTQIDPATTGGMPVPWKATDAIVWLLGAAGVATAQISIPDLPLRLWSGTGEKADQFVLDQNTDYADMAQRIARNYMGLYLCHDLPTDTWTLLQGTPLDAPPLHAFYTESANQIAGSNAFVGHGGYGPNGTLITEFHQTNVPPDFTGVHVMCPIPQTSAGSKQVIETWYTNYAAYSVPGGSPPDPLNPDYTSAGAKDAEIIDPSLYCGPGRDAETQAAVDWTARRYFDFSCHGQKLAHFESPLPFLLDPVTGLYRLPRFLDPISINGQPWQVKCCAPHYTWDGKQMAAWEAIQPVAGQYVPPGIESLSFLRNATARHSQKAAGSSQHGYRFASLSAPPHAEGRVRDLPRNVENASPVQDPVTGQPYFMLGYDRLDSGAPLQ